MSSAGKTWKKEYRELVEVPTYHTVHSRRLPKFKGSASDFQCVDCGSQARQWSYDGKDPEELTGYSGKRRNLRYSLNLYHYEPRCYKCHIKFDGDTLCRNKLHEMTDANTYVDRAGYSNCKACRSAASKRRVRQR